MQSSISQPANGSRCVERVSASAHCKAWASPRTHIGWINISRLTRECMIDVVTRADPSFNIMPFETASDCITVSTDPLDLIIYHCRGDEVTDLQELTELRNALPNVRLLVMSDSVRLEPTFVQRILAAGTSGFILTSSNGLDMLVSAIRLVSSGGTVVSREFFMAESSPKRAPARGDVHRTPRITRRERSVLELIKRGKPNKIIAYELGLSVCTVKIHARNLIQKMGAANRTQAAMNADKFLWNLSDTEGN